MIHSRKPRRHGGVLLEAALVYPILGLFLIGTVTMGLGIFSFQQIASLSREGARWASVHGALYAQATGNAMATPAEVYNTAILPLAAGLDTTKLSYTVTWANANQMPTNTDPQTMATVTNTVTVTVTYQWYPAAYLGGPVTLTSTAVMPMSF
jgi:Flp pilus assembly protein TadG